MSNCIRTRRRFSTPLEDILWKRHQERETRFIALTEETKLKAQKVAEILAGCTFQLDENTTLYDAGGKVCYQVGMNVVSKSDCSNRFLVIAKLVEEGEEWSCECPPFLEEDGPLVIQAVQTRVEQKRNQKQSQKLQTQNLQTQNLQKAA